MFLVDQSQNAVRLLLS